MNEPSGAGRCLRISFSGEGGAATPVFILPEELGMQGYQFLASPQVYPGQGIVARVRAVSEMKASIFVTVYEAGGGTRKISGPAARLRAGKESVLCMAIPDTCGQPVAEIGVEARSPGAAFVDLLGMSWHGSPNVSFRRPPVETGAKDLGVWRRAWVNAVDTWDGFWREAYRLCQNSGRGLIIQGCRDWTDYEAEAEISITMAKAAGIAVRVQGLRRYYALLLRDSGRAELVKFDREEKVLASAVRETRFGPKIRLRLRAEGPVLKAWIDGDLVFEREDATYPLDGGAVAFVVEEGQLTSDELTVRP